MTIVEQRPSFSPAQDSMLRLPGPGVAGLVSVVIPSYNRAYIVGKAIASVLSQTYPDVEVIVVDDGSTDHTRDVVTRFDERVCYVAQANSGVCSARNTGLRLARGEFVALLDSDDEWLPWKLAAQVAVMRAHPEVGMAWTDMVAVSADGPAGAVSVVNPAFLRTFYSGFKTSGFDDAMKDTGALSDVWSAAPSPVASARVRVGDIFSEMLLGNHVHTSTVLLRRSRLRHVGLFDERLRKSGEDYEFHLRTCYYGPVALIEASSILYRIGSLDQLTQPAYIIYMARNDLTTVETWLARGKDRIKLSLAQVAHRLAESHAWIGECELGLGNRFEALKQLTLSLWLSPDGRVARLWLLVFMPMPVQSFAIRFWRRLKSLHRLHSAHVARDRSGR